MELAKAHLTVVDIGIVENTNSNKRFELSGTAYNSTETAYNSTGIAGRLSMTLCVCRQLKPDPMQIMEDSSVGSRSYRSTTHLKWGLFRLLYCVSSCSSI